MPEYVGSSLFLRFGGVILSADFRKLTTEETAEIVDGSAGSDVVKPKYATQTDASASVDLVDQTGGTAQWAILRPGTSGTLEWGPEGTATGLPKHTATAIVSKRTRDVPYDNVVETHADFDITSVVTDAAY